MMRYAIVIEKTPNNYSAYPPDLPGCAATGATLSPEALTAMFDPKVDAKRVDQTEGKDMVAASAVNFHAPEVTQKEADAFYAKMVDKNDPEPLEWGLNSRLEKGPDGKLRENVWKSGGMYGPAIDQIVMWLGKAAEVAENDKQKKALLLLIDYFKTGDLAKWSDFNIAWTQATDGDIDYILGFVEVYHDPMGMRGSYEAIVQINNLDASQKMAVLSKNAQWFEDHSPLMDNHKKKSVTGITYKMVKVAGESGDASPATPIGVNLPNPDWIRAKYGSKSVSLGNIEEAYNNSAGAGILKEFSKKICDKTGNGKLYRMSEKIESVVGPEKKLPSNVDFYSATVLYCLGIPKSLAPCPGMGLRTHLRGHARHRCWWGRG